jgi:hypothetical protein
MPYPNEHAARLLQPRQFDSFARQSIVSGISLILGIKDGKSTAQAYRFKKDKFTVDEAKKWLADHNIKYISFEPAANKKAVQSFIELQCFKVSQLTQEEILSHIPQSEIERIRQKDDHPFFQAYSIAHEGVSSPRIVGEGAKPISWGRAAIQSLKKIITKGVKFFKGHRSTNDTQGRKVLGEVVSDFQQEIDGKLHHIVISYHSPEVREEAKKYDIVSQEAEWNLFDQSGQLFAGAIDKLTGIAMGSSERENPAFAGAKRLGMIQAFDDGGEPDKIKTGEKHMTIQEVKAAVQEMGLWPSQLFDPDRVKADHGFSKLFEEAEKTKADLAAKDNEIKALEESIAMTEKKVLAANAKDRLDEMLKSNILKLTERQKEYIKANYDPKREDVTDDAIRAYTEKAAAEYEKNAKFFGSEGDTIKRDGTAPPAGDDLTKAENNPLLEEDL